MSRTFEISPVIAAKYEPLTMFALIAAYLTQAYPACEEMSSNPRTGLGPVMESHPGSYLVEDDG